MRQSRIFTSQHLQVETSVQLEGPASHYLTRVLRLSKGDDVILFNGDGSDYSAVISEIRPQRVLARVTASSTPGNESPLKITLAQSVCRGERMDYVLQKATELGVFCIQPLISQRVEVRFDASRQEKRLSHWRGVVTSACEQSGRALVPEVKKPMSLPDWINDTAGPVRLVLDPLAAHRLSGVSVQEGSVSVLVGPEGGFTDDEMNAARANGLVAVSLGPRVLRTETAGPAAIALLQAKSGDF
ncbi:MAG: 16S rRNA (uracil(1498)-N(3))-methyltransferase [Lysobacterales bacterium]